MTDVCEALGGGGEGEAAPVAAAAAAAVEEELLGAAEPLVVAGWPAEEVGGARLVLEERPEEDWVVTEVLEEDLRVEPTSRLKRRFIDDMEGGAGTWACAERGKAAAAAGQAGRQEDREGGRVR